jgi:hypothetical protein
MVLSIGFVVVIASIRHYLISYNDILQHLSRWPCKNAPVMNFPDGVWRIQIFADTVYKILNKEVHIIPIPWAMDGAWLNSRAEVFETSALSCGLSLAMSSVNTVASWLAREIET